MLRQVFAIGLTCCMAFTSSASARDTASVIPVSDISDDDLHRVIDLRDAETCLAGSLPQARCLPVGHFIDPTGKVIGFHALRWLLGTVGLKGDETVLVVGDSAEDTHRVGALLHRAGQHRIKIFDKPFRVPANAPPGTPRSLSRETVFTAPMRDDLYGKNKD